MKEGLQRIKHDENFGQILYTLKLHIMNVLLARSVAQPIAATLSTTQDLALLWVSFQYLRDHYRPYINQ